MCKKFIQEFIRFLITVTYFVPLSVCAIAMTGDDADAVRENMRQPLFQSVTGEDLLFIPNAPQIYYVRIPRKKRCCLEWLCCLKFSEERYTGVVPRDDREDRASSAGSGITPPTDSDSPRALMRLEPPRGEASPLHTNNGTT